VPDYETLRVIWWLILGVLLVGFALTDGFDLGVGAIFRFVGRSDEERRALLESIVPVWEGNQVWFVLAGGATFAAWPRLYAASFSGLYLAMFLLLLALILRPVAFNFRNKRTDRGWRELWDWALCVAGTVPALLFGVAFGNLFRGIPYQFDALARPVYGGGFLNLLNPFAVLAGLVSLAMLVMHGASYAALKTGEPMAARAARVARGAALVYLLLFALAGVWVAFALVGQRIAPGSADAPIRSVTLAAGAWLDNYRAHPPLWLVPVTALAGAAVNWGLLGARRPLAAFLLSGLAVAATILTAGIALFPFLLPSSSHPQEGLTVWNAASSQRTLLIMLVVVVIFLPLVLAYTAWVFRTLRGRITLEELHGHGDQY
jgi:cytochrome d ubiquinol oxidase subunit II